MGTHAHGRLTVAAIVGTTAIAIVLFVAALIPDGPANPGDGTGEASDRRPGLRTRLDTSPHQESHAEAPKTDETAASDAASGLASDRFRWPAERYYQFTNLQRRLILGGYLRALLEDLRLGRLAPADATRRFRRAEGQERRMAEFKPLALDQLAALEKKHGVQDDARDADYPVEAVLTGLVHRRLDLATLRLVGAEASQDPLGSDLLARVWTRTPLERAHIGLRSGERFVRWLQDLGLGPTDAARFPSLGNEYDILCLDDLGSRTFPELGIPQWVHSLTSPGDGVSIMRRSKDAGFSKRLLKYQLFHAWKSAFRMSWGGSIGGIRSGIFSAEGIATYLSWSELGDDEWTVPLDRLRDDMACLADWIAWMEKQAGAPLDLDLRAFVACDDELFNSYAPFSVLLAQACCAYLGHKEVVKALGPDETLRFDAGFPGKEANFERSMARIDWPKLRAFITDSAVGGVVAHSRTIVGRVPQFHDHFSRWSLLFASEFTALGLPVHAMWLAARNHPQPEQDAIAYPAQVKRVTQQLSELATKGKLVFMTEATSWMDEPFRPLTTLGHAPRIPAEPNASVETRMSYVAKWLLRLSAHTPDRTVPTFGVTSSVAPLKIPFAPEVSGLSLNAVDSFVRDGRSEATGMIVCIASHDPQWLDRQRGELVALGIIRADAPAARVEEALMRASAAPDRRRGPDRPRWLLVVDMGAGQTQARLFARTLAASATGEGQSMNVAYWDPQAKAASSK